MNGNIFENLVPASEETQVIEIGSLVHYLEQLVDPRAAR